MEFDDRDEEEHEEEDDDDEDINLPPPQSYDSVPQPSSPRPHLGQLAGPRKPTATKYRECLKNHAVSIGGHATDGCGEFLPAGDEGTLDALKCAACGCHRNFHRKETDVGIIDPHMAVSPLAVARGGAVVAAAANSAAAAAMYHHPLPPYYHHHRTTPPPTGYLQLGASGGGMAALNSPTLPSQHPHHLLQYRPLALPSPRDEMDDMSHPSSSGGGGGGGGSGGNYGGGATGKKRFRTKFSQEQKEKMLVFAERVGWRLQKQDEALVQQFCQEAQVKRQVLKVWMHNNKHTLGKKP